MKYSIQVPPQMQALSKITENPCMYGTVMFIFNICHHFKPSLSNNRTKNYNANNQGLLKLNTIMKKIRLNNLNDFKFKCTLDK